MDTPRPDSAGPLHYDPRFGYSLGTPDSFAPFPTDPSPMFGRSPLPFSPEEMAVRMAALAAILDDAADRHGLPRVTDEGVYPTDGLVRLAGAVQASRPA